MQAESQLPISSGPGYQILQGRHPSGVPYRIQVDAPAFEIDVTSLMWIDGRRLVDHIKYHKEGGTPFRRERHRNHQRRY